MQAFTTLELQFWVRKDDGTSELATTLVVEDATFGFTATIDDMALTIAVTKLNVGSVKVLQCSFGKLSAITIKLEINNGFRIFQPELNHLLAQRVVQFPTNVFGLFELKQLTLSFYDNYIYAGITPIFIAPTAFKAVS
jgi:hypothetical protein